MIDDLLNQTITVAKRVGNDGRGHYTYGAPKEHRARVEHKPRLVRSNIGDTTNRFEKVSNARVYVEASASIEIGDKITLPDGSVPIIILVAPQYDMDGALAYWRVDV
ncbi:MAG: hypothetical protein A4E30_00760 [Methanomassiliicoccales archaeon PtaB.Bin215]|nr:MAG: hypothetical protein A4E30_00760 [Methanomassiliicoccales archaeon PtaB.Bin215]